MKLEKGRFLNILATVEIILLFILGVAMIFEAIYPVDSFFKNPTPEQARAIGAVFGALMMLFSYTYFKEHDMIEMFKKNKDVSVKH
jgi:amino acid transporter